MHLCVKCFRLMADWPFPALYLLMRLELVLPLYIASYWHSARVRISSCGLTRESFGGFFLIVWVQATLP